MSRTQLLQRVAYSAFAIFAILYFAPQAFCQSSEDCLLCHSSNDLTMKKGGRTVSLYVNGAHLKSSAHASMPCVECHKGFSPTDIPHAKGIRPVRCQACHEIAGFEKSVHGKPAAGAGKSQTPGAACKDCHGTHDIRAVRDLKSSTNRLNIPGTCAKCHKKASQEFQTSIHGTGVAAGVSKSPSCIDCHGAHNIASIGNRESTQYKTNEAKLCLKCHLNDPEIRKRIGASAGFIAGYQTSVHGIALASGNAKAAVCGDCHGIHDLKRAGDSSSLVNRQNITATCGRCHADVGKAYRESIHGVSVQRGGEDAPTCTYCHGEHQIYSLNDPRSPLAPRNLSEQICAACHNSVQLNRKYEIASDRFTSFSDSYHGLASRAGSVKVANCASCHGVHSVKPSSDPTSTVNAANLVSTCGHCHPGANNNFTIGAVHVIEGRASKGGVLYWIRTIYISLIIIVIGGMFVHNLLDFIKRSRHRVALRQGRAPHEHYGDTLYLRMTLSERIQHALMFSSFIILAITGFMLRFPDSWWVAPIRQLSENFFDIRSVLHRVAAVVMIAISLYHIVHLIFTKRGRQFTRDVWIKWKDIGPFWTNLGYIAGLSKKKPRFDRFGYIEKAEYWALVWGVVIMSATGIVMWFDNYFMGLLTKFGYDISRTVHFYEACLATLAILVWHFYFVIFSPSVYPMSTAWITGKISEEEMAEEHPLELERIKSAQLNE